MGSVPLSEMLGVGEPVVVTVNVPAVPRTNVVLFALVIAGAWPTVNVKLCTAFDPTPFDAVNVIGNEPPCVGVPESVPVPLWLSTKLTPVGSVPLSEILAVGKAVVVTVNVPAIPVLNVVLFALVMTGD